jgi:hypothetical protein
VTTNNSMHLCIYTHLHNIANHDMCILEHQQYQALKTSTQSLCEYVLFQTRARVPASARVHTRPAAAGHAQLFLGFG